MALLFNTKKIYETLTQLSLIRAQIIYQGERPDWKTPFSVLEEEIEKIGIFCDENPEVNVLALYVKMLHVKDEYKNFYETRFNFTMGLLLDDLLQYLIADFEERIEAAQIKNYLHLQ